MQEDNRQAADLPPSSDDTVISVTIPTDLIVVALMLAAIATEVLLVGRWDIGLIWPFVPMIVSMSIILAAILMNMAQDRGLVRRGAVNWLAVGDGADASARPLLVGGLVCYLLPSLAGRRVGGIEFATGAVTAMQLLVLAAAIVTAAVLALAACRATDGAETSPR